MSEYTWAYLFIDWWLIIPMSLMFGWSVHCAQTRASVLASMTASLTTRLLATRLVANQMVSLKSLLLLLQCDDTMIRVASILLDYSYLKPGECSDSEILNCFKKTYYRNKSFFHITDFKGQRWRLSNLKEVKSTMWPHIVKSDGLLENYLWQFLIPRQTVHFVALGHLSTV